MTALTGRNSDTNTSRPGRPARYGGVFAAVVAAALIGYAGVAIAGFEVSSDEPIEVEPAPQPEERVALVIGNGRYEHVHDDRSAHKDAEGVGAALERLGFTVTTLMDAGYVDMLWGLREFAQAARSARAAVVFYVGQGYAADGRNFLVPADTNEAAFNAAHEGGPHVREGGLGWIPLEWVVRSVAPPTVIRGFGGGGLARVVDESSFRLVILDTDVPAPLGPTADATVALAATVGTHPAMGEGGDYSPYVDALLRHLEEPGIELGMLFRKVRVEVMRATEGRQEPAVYGLPGRGVYLGSIPSPPPASDSDLQEPAEGGLTR